MAPRNVIISGNSTLDSRFVLKLAGAQVDASHPSPTGIFEFKEYSVTTSKQEYVLYDTAGLTDSDADRLCISNARQALSNLYHLTHLEKNVHLLIYVVSGPPSVNNLKIFYDYLCRQDVPMILITTNPIPPSMPYDFLHVPVLTLDGALPENDTKQVQNAIIRQVRKKEPKNIGPMERFELTTRESWKLLEKEVGWSLKDCREALQATFVEDARFSKEEAQARCKEIVEYIKKHYFCNVIVFGDTGVGKTSVIRMLTDECEIDKSSTGGSTSKSQSYDIVIGGYHYRFHDTVGLDDQTSTSTSPEEALRNLYQLILNVDGGLSLLVYVHRGKIKPSQVPTALVVTGLENQDLARDDWWNDNERLFTAQKIETKYHACITSTKGKFNSRHNEFVYQIEYNQSSEKLKKLFLTAALEKPWKVNKTANFQKLFAVQVYNIFATKLKWGPLAANPSLQKRLMGVIGMDEDAATSLANNLERVGHL